MKKIYKVLLVIVIAVGLMCFTDYQRIKEETYPIFSFPHRTLKSQFHIGFLFYYKAPLSDAPKPYYLLSDKKVGIWFLPGININTDKP